MQSWFCSTVYQGKEKWAKLNLEKKDFETYLPQCVSGWKNRQPVIRPFLPGYLFVRVEPDDRNQWRPLFSTAGVKSVICSGEKPQVVQDWIVAGIQEREVDGLVRLEPRVECRFKQGDVVRMRGSPLDALFQEMTGHDRALVLINLFGKQLPKTVMLSRLSAAAQA